jgi:hypothetical protein
VFRVHKWETFPKLGDGLELLPCPRPLILGMPPTPGGGGGGGARGALPCTRFKQQLENILYDIKIVEHKGPNTHVIIHAKAPIGGTHGTKK